MISIAWDGNDKAILVVIFVYPILTILNAIVWTILRVLKRPEFKIYRITTIGLAILFVPTLFMSSFY
jgi:hypothetical protein